MTIFVVAGCVIVWVAYFAVVLRLASQRDSSNKWWPPAIVAIVFTPWVILPFTGWLALSFISS